LVCTEQILWNFKVCRKNNFTEHFLKKICAGQICPGWAEAAQIRPRSSEERGAAAATFEPASGARLSVTPGDRIGIRPVRSFDQVKIDGRRSSSTQKRSEAAETLGFRLGVAGAHQGAAGRQGRVGGDCGGSWWSRFFGGEAGVAPGFDAVEGSCRCSGSARQWGRAPLDLAKMKGMIRSGRRSGFQREGSWEGRGRDDGNLHHGSHIVLAQDRALPGEGEPGALAAVRGCVSGELWRK
jgi:hypothetical protein